MPKNREKINQEIYELRTKGLDGKPLTLEAIGKRYGITRQGVLQKYNQEVMKRALAVIAKAEEKEATNE